MEDPGSPRSFNPYTLRLRDAHLSEKFDKNRISFWRNIILISIYIFIKFPASLELIILDLDDVHWYWQISRVVLLSVLLVLIVLLKNKSAMTQTIIEASFAVAVMCTEALEEAIYHRDFHNLYFFLTYVLGVGMCYTLCFVVTAPLVIFMAIFYFICIAAGGFYTAAGSPYLTIIYLFWPAFVCILACRSLEQQAIRLFFKNIAIEEQKNELRAEEQKWVRLLNNVFPCSIANVLTKRENPEMPCKVDESCVTFNCEILLSLSDQMKVAATCFKTMDQIVKACGEGVEKIKTTGLRYIVACGLPDALELHADVAIKLALQFQEELLSLNESCLEFFIGIDSGSVIGGVIGTITQNFDIWGDTVNCSARMAFSCAPCCIRFTENTKKVATLALPADIPEACIPIKGKGCMNVFTLSPGTLSFPTAKVNRQSSLASRSSSSTAREEDISQLLLSPSYSIWHKLKYMLRYFLLVTPEDMAEWQSEAYFQNFLATGGYYSFALLIFFILSFWVNDVIVFPCTINRFIRILVVPIILVGYILLRRFPKLFYINVLLITLCTLLCTSMVALIDSNCADNRYTVEIAPACLLCVLLFNLDIYAATFFAFLSAVLCVGVGLRIGNFIDYLYLYEILAVAPISSVASYFVQGSFLKMQIVFFHTYLPHIPQRKTRLLRAQQKKQDKITQCKKLVESIIPPQLCSVLIGNTVHRMLESNTNIRRESSSFDIDLEDDCALLNIYNGTAIICADIVEFTKKCSVLDPSSILRVLNDTFSLLDDIASKFGLIKVKTIGDAVMYAAGLESLDWRKTKKSESHEASFADMAKNSAKAFLCAVEIMQHFQQNAQTGALVRIGCSSGSALGGILTRYKFAFDIYGRTVDEAEFLSAQGGSNMQLSICETTLKYVADTVESYLASSPSGVTNSEDKKGKMSRGVTESHSEISFLAITYVQQTNSL